MAKRASTATGPATIPDLIDSLVSRSGDDIALIAGDDRISFRDLADRSARLAQGLEGLGLGQGDIAALWLQNDPNWLVALLACARIGVNAIALNTRFRHAELTDVFTRLSPRAIFYQPVYRGIDFAAIVDAACQESRLADMAEIFCAPPTGQSGLTVEGLIEENTQTTTTPRDAADNLIMFATSGTTGSPKFVQHTHGSVVSHAIAVGTGFGMAATDTKMLQALPYCGVFGFCQAMGALAVERPSVVLENFDPEDAVVAIPRHRVTHVNMTDDMLSACASAAQDVSVFSSLRFVGAASFNRGAGHLDEIARATGIPIVGLYGSSEAQALFARRSIDAPSDRRCEAGGRPVSPEADIRVRDVETGKLLTTDDVGELEICGPSLFSGYVNDPEATARAMTADGYFRTGDLALLERSGEFRFDARMGDAIRLGGFLVNPDEISGFIETIGGIGDCIVVGVQTPDGPKAAAFVIRDPNFRGGHLDGDAVRDQCRKYLAPYKVPALVHEIEVFPVTDGPNGVKVQRGELRALAGVLLGQ
ncbi:MAG: AMP-binding protein [Alphaproteobacteria bacterium]